MEVERVCDVCEDVPDDEIMSDRAVWAAQQRQIDMLPSGPHEAAQSSNDETVRRADACGQLRRINQSKTHDLTFNLERLLFFT